MLLRQFAAPQPFAATGHAPARGEIGEPAVPDLGHGPHAPFALPPLPYSLRALSPIISARTLQYHYRRHHAGYLSNLNRQLTGHPMAGEPLITVIRETRGGTEPGSLFNNAAQVWNHSFYWRCLIPGGGKPPAGRLASAIERDFGGFTALADRLITAATSHFASGWVWLCAENGYLSLQRTANADTPIRQPGRVPLLTIDVWEHAYYLDYQNRRSDYAVRLVDRLLNWPFAAQIFQTHLEQVQRDQAALTLPTASAPAPAPVTPPAPASEPAEPAPAREPAAAPRTAPGLVLTAPADTRSATFSRLARLR